ncbi:MAG: glycerol-3-phosphate 1-O-acyltransferase PlsY [Gemmatimonadetes bacterium]|nr:glycerol-3-phosphate 1-O-acyltransferase PlsY [Gemmatimonadota bacterium]MBI2402127.1 glycerol-3-phosphate 1-O-acyltransferase PlsY [Gemmatimonadota bacterium]
MTLALWLLAAYLLGAIPTSYLVGRWFGGIDLREHGSKNLGATNLYRTLGWRYAVPAGLFDVAKGAIPVVAFAPRAGSQEWVPLSLGVAAIIGHVFSLFVRFRGGKGVATAAGAVLGLAPLPLALSAVVWVTLVWATGYVSLASMSGAAAFPLAVWLLQPGDPYILVAGVLLATFIVFTHRTNIRRLLEGREARFGHHAAP